MLVHVVTNANRSIYSKQLEAMHRLRHQVFVETKGWTDLRRTDGLEVDQFDHEQAVYLIAIDDVGEVTGALRLIPTCASHLLANSLRDYVTDLDYVAPFAWEFSRWMPGAIGKRNTVVESRPRLLTAVIEFALSRNIESFVAVCETKRLSTFAEMGWEVAILGDVRSFEQDRRAVAVRWRPRRKDLDYARSYFGFAGPVSIEAPCAYSDAEFSPMAASALSELMSFRNPESYRAALEFMNIVAANERSQLLAAAASTPLADLPAKGRA